jgi:hypothetical protein
MLKSCKELIKYKMAAHVPETKAAGPPSQQPSDEPNLRSLREVLGYPFEASDGRIGHVEDLIFKDDTWAIQYLAVDTKDWLPGRKVLVAVQWIENVSCSNSSVSIDLERRKIKNSPEYDPNEPVNREYEEVLYDYYGRPKYWAESRG